MSEPDWIGDPIWIGQGPVDGLWLPHALRSEAERRRLLWQWWQLGARALRFAEADVLIWQRPQLLSRLALPGLALVRVGPALWSSAPIDAKSLATLNAGIALIEAGRLRLLPLQAGQALDLTPWLNVHEYPVLPRLRLRKQDFGPALPDFVGKPLREVVREVPPASAEQLAFLRQRSVSARASETSAKGVGQAVGRTLATTSFVVSGIATGLLGLLTSWWRTRSGGARAEASGGGSYRASGRSTRQAEAREDARAPGRLSLWQRTWSNIVERLQLGRLFGSAHAAFMARMMQLFEDGQLQEALRHAIPLAGGEQDQLISSLQAPKPRDSLALTETAGVKIGVDLPVPIEQRLRQLYEAAFKQLERRGEIDQAVYVLAHLLGRRQEALDLLERHQRYRQAAELALNWQMPTATQIRLLWLAGEVARAVALARRNGEFSEVLARLATEQSELAQAVRREYALYLADRGDFVAAVELAWSVPDLQVQAAQWLLQAEQMSALSEVDALVLRALLSPQSLRVRESTLRSICFAETEFERREWLARALAARPKNEPGLAQIAAWLYAPLLADRLHGRNALSESSLNELRARTNDPLLKQDLPPMQLPVLPERCKLGTQFDRISIDSAQGSRAISDAAPLPGRRYLLALGESGVALVDRIGQVLRHYNVPATRLATPEAGHMALALIERDQHWRISRIDLHRHEVTEYGRLPLNHFDPVIRGVTFNVVSADRLLALDATRDANAVLWHVSGLPGPVRAARFNADWQSFLFETSHGPEFWRYQMPQRRLLSRDQPDLAEGREHVLMPDHHWAQYQVLSGLGVHDLRYQSAVIPEVVVSLPMLKPWSSGEPMRVTVLGQSFGLLIVIESEQARRLVLFSTVRQRLIGEIDWPRDTHLSILERDQHLLLYDQAGRLLHLPMAECDWLLLRTQF